MSSEQMGQLAGKIIAILLGLGLLQYSVRRLRTPHVGKIFPAITAVLAILLVLNGIRLLVSAGSDAMAR